MRVERSKKVYIISGTLQLSLDFLECVYYLFLQMQAVTSVEDLTCYCTLNAFL